MKEKSRFKFSFYHFEGESDYSKTLFCGQLLNAECFVLQISWTPSENAVSLNFLFSQTVLSQTWDLNQAYNKWSNLDSLKTKLKSPNLCQFIGSSWKGQLFIGYWLLFWLTRVHLKDAVYFETFSCQLIPAEKTQFSSPSLLSYCLTTDVELRSKTGKEGCECNVKISDGNFMLSFDPSPCR